VWLIQPVAQLRASGGPAGLVKSRPETDFKPLTK
jgi:hypothetical protein